MAEEFAHGSETYASDSAWEEELEHGACTRIRDRQTDSSDDIAECSRQNSHTPICIAYKNFASIWFDMRDEKTPNVNWFEDQSEVVDSLGTKRGSPDPEYYNFPAFKRTLHRILNIAFARDRTPWKDHNEFAQYIYKSCLEDRPLEPTIVPTAPLTVHGRSERSLLGVRVQDVTPEIAENLGLPKAEGALVAGLTPGGPAEEIGIKPGDVIEAYGGHDIVKMHDLLLAVAETQIGQRTNVKLWRNGQELVLAPTIVAMPNNLETPPPVAPIAQEPVRTLPADQNPQNQTGSQQPPAASAQGKPAPPSGPSTVYMPGQTVPPVGDGHWYYCDATQAYYPFVQACSVPWRQVAASGTLPPAPPAPAWVQQGGAVFQKIWADRLAELAAGYRSAIEEAKRAIQTHKLQEEAMALERKRKEEDEKIGYKYLSVSDFVLDKKILSSQTKLIIHGFYQPVGDVDWLVEYPGIPDTPKIGLLADDAPRNVRATLQRCRLSHGCGITLIGHVGECERTFLGTAYETDKCLFVDGIR